MVGGHETRHLEFDGQLLIYLLNWIPEKQLVSPTCQSRTSLNQEWQIADWNVPVDSCIDSSLAVSISVSIPHAGFRCRDVASGVSCLVSLCLGVEFIGIQKGASRLCGA